MILFDYKLTKKEKKEMDKYLTKVTIVLAIFIFFIIVLMGTNDKVTSAKPAAKVAAVNLEADSLGAKAIGKPTKTSSGQIATQKDVLAVVEYEIFLDDNKVKPVIEKEKEKQTAAAEPTKKDAKPVIDTQPEVRNPFISIVDLQLDEELENIAAQVIPTAGALAAGVIKAGTVINANKIPGLPKLGSSDKEAKAKPARDQELEKKTLYGDAPSAVAAIASDADTPSVAAPKDVPATPENGISPETKALADSVVESLNKKVRRPILVYTNRYRGAHSDINTDILRSIQQFNEDGSSVVTKYIDVGGFAGNLDESEYYNADNELVKKEYYNPKTEEIISVRVYRN
jgi:hypothetical protein